MSARFAAIAAGLLSLAAASTGIAQSADALASLAGLESGATGQAPETAGREGMLTITGHTHIISATPTALVLEYAGSVVHADKTVSRRAKSRVTIPLGAVSLASTTSGVKFHCIDGSSCMQWVHLDFYDEGGATYGDTGTASDYSVALDSAAAQKLTSALCTVAHCS